MRLRGWPKRDMQGRSLSTDHMGCIHVSYDYNFDWSLRWFLLLPLLLLFLLLYLSDLERLDFLKRQIIFGKMLSSSHPLKHVIDIGAYYNPIHLFLSIDACPITVIIVEPILDALSVNIPCNLAARENANVSISNPSYMTHVVFLPITFKHYLTIKTILPEPETVVCIGCDRYGVVMMLMIMMMINILMM